MHIGVILTSLGVLCLVSADPVLRYNESSCNSLEPVYVEENWQRGVVTTDMGDEEDLGLFNTPKRSFQRVPPFQIQVDFDQYRRNRRYKVRIVALQNQNFDSFLLQARAAQAPDGNATLVGSFLSPLPGIAESLACLRRRDSSVTDRGRPVQLRELIFDWLSPNQDFGQIRFIASLVSNNEYSVIESRQITFNTFPVSLQGCGRHVSCFRQCGGGGDPTCPVDRSNYVAVWSYDQDKQEAVVSMGARIMDMEMGMGGKKKDKDDDEDDEKMEMTDNSWFIAMGFGMDKRDHKMMDITACYMEPNASRPTLGHYFLEDRGSRQLYSHKAPVSLLTWDMDTATGFLWCNFSRPVYSRNIWELDLSLQLYQFYFLGTFNDTGLYMPSDKKNVWGSSRKQNFTRITNAIEYEPYQRGPKSLARNDASEHSWKFAIICFMFSIKPLLD